MTRFLVLGDALLDVHATPAEPIRPGGDVPAVVRLGVGGQGANLAVRLARHGMDVRLASAAGEDEMAPLVRDRLERAGVDAVPMPSFSTGAVVILLDGAGERTMLSHRVPFAPALAERLPDLVGDAEWVVVSGYLLEEPGPILRADHVGGARRVVVGSPFRDVAAWAAALEALAPHVVVLNRVEAAALANGASTPDLAAAVAARFAATLVVVTEATGATAVLEGHDPLPISTPSDPSVIDTTGAGDAFAATMLAEIAVGFPPPADALRSAMQRAAAFAAAVSRVVGAQAAVPAAEETHE